jgi:transposase InsO family protein
MIPLLSALISLLSFRLRSRSSLELELIALRHQVAVLRRQRPGRPKLFCADRLLWVWLYRIWPQALHAMVLVKPATVIQWHRKGFRLYWRWRSQSGYPGRPKTCTEVRNLIRQMSIANPLWGAPRIHGELLKLGIVVSQATVGRYMSWRPKVPSPTWRSFLRNHMSGTVAVDMFVVATATFRLLYTVIVLGHDRRRIIHFNVTQNPTQVWLAHQMTEAFPWDTAPQYLLRDRDASYGRAFRNRIQAMGITEVVTAARSPWQNAYVERIIGSVRRECLDHIIIFDERHLRGVLSRRERISRSTRIVRRAVRYTHPLRARLFPSRRSVVCIIATNGSLLNVLWRPYRDAGFSAEPVRLYKCVTRMYWHPKLVHGGWVAAATVALLA